MNAFLFARVIDCDYSLSNWWSPLIDLRRDGLAVVIECRRLDDDWFLKANFNSEDNFLGLKFASSHAFLSYLWIYVISSLFVIHFWISQWIQFRNSWYSHICGIGWIGQFKVTPPYEGSIFLILEFLLKWPKENEWFIMSLSGFMIKVDLRVVKDVYFCPKFSHYHIGPDKNV